MAKAAITLGLFALLVVIIVGIALTVYFTTKKSKSKSKSESDDEEPSEKKPELAFDMEAIKTINPQAEDNGTQEGYSIEYAGGEFIDLTLNWTNGQGFENVVNELIFTRYVENATGGEDQVQANKKTKVLSEISDYGSGSIKFKGSEVNNVNTKGVNVVRAYYNEVKEDNLLATAKLEITEDDFDQVMTGEFSEIIIPVTIPEDSFSLTRTVKKTYYQLSLDAVDQSIKYVSSITNKKVNGYWYTVKQDGDIFKFIREDGKEVQLGSEKNSEFKIQTYKDGGKILIHAGDCLKATSAALCNKAKGKIYVNEGENGAYFSVDEMTSDRWTKAQFTIINVLSTTWPRGSCDLVTAKKEIGAKLNNAPHLQVNQVGGDSCLNNNCPVDCWREGFSVESCDRNAAKLCLEDLMESTASTNFKATANTTAGNACSTKFNCEPDIWF